MIPSPPERESRPPEPDYPCPDSSSPERSVSTKPCTSNNSKKRQREQNSPPTLRVTRSQTRCKADTNEEGKRVTQSTTSGKAHRNEDGYYTALDYEVTSPSSSD